VSRGTPWRSILIAGIVLFCAALWMGGCGAPPQERPRTRLRFASAGGGAAFYPLGEGLAREYERALPGLQVEVDQTDGSVSHVEAIQKGEADIGLTYADVAYLAYVGRLERRREPFVRLRGIAMLQLSRVHVVVRGDSGIHRLEDLRGRRVGLERPALGANSTARMVLNAVGIDLQGIVVEPLRLDEAVARLTHGTLDALFTNGTAPIDAIVVAANAGARVLPVDGPAIDGLRRDYPFFSPAVIAAGTYPRHPTDIRTIGVDSLLVCRADLAEPLVHDLTQRLFEILPLLASPQFSLSSMDLRQAPATPIPLHAGAARYYRERELFR
jgi:TRAP transporter TAXI family solute receptor